METGMEFVNEYLSPTIMDAFSDRLRYVKRLAEEACRMAEVARVEGAINWADLHCVQAEQYMTDAGFIGYRVWVEEASPCNEKLRDYITSHLASKGFNDVEVCTEW